MFITLPRPFVSLRQLGATLFGSRFGSPVVFVERVVLCGKQPGPERCRTKPLMKRVLITAVLVLASSMCAFGQDSVARDAGVERYRSGEFQKAVDELEPIVNAGRADQITAMYLAGSYVHLKRSKDATALFKKIHAGKFGKFVDGVESDKPVKITSKAVPEFDPSDREFGREVHVYLAVEYKADGSLGFIFPFESSTPLTRETGIRATKTIKFEPALHKGKPVTKITFVDYSYGTR